MQFHPQLQHLSQQTLAPSRSTSDVSSPSAAGASDTPNTKKKRFSKLRIRGGNKASDRPKVYV